MSSKPFGPAIDASSCKQRLLQSLNDGNPFTRSKNVSKSSEGTFQWIFGHRYSRRSVGSVDDPDGPDSSDSSLGYDDSDDYDSSESGDGDDGDDGPIRQNSRPKPEAKFLDWLQHGEGVFWILGKPGSGKSTLMKFLTGVHNQNQETLLYLGPWAQPKPPRLLSFYFWLADTSNIQNSLRGFLCHILYQLLESQSPDSISSLPAIDRYLKNKGIVDWDLDELEVLFTDFARQAAAETPLCLFIDGLDECTARDIDSVVRIIRDLASHPDSKIKVCVSSRPEQKLHNRLGPFVAQKLELHDLTARDIRRYVTRELKFCWQSCVLPTKEQRRTLIDQLVYSSQGVFLWAFLVTKKLCESIEFGDTISQVQQQLRELPHGMMELYENMIGKSDALKGNRKAEAASYFQFVLNHSDRCIYLKNPKPRPPMRRFHSEIGIRPFYEHYNGKLQLKTRQAICDRVRQRINFLCAGLVVVWGADDPGLGSVGFFHRTARDFFNEAQGKEILRQSKLTQLDSYCLFVDGVCMWKEVYCGHDKFTEREAGQMVNWVRCMGELTETERVKFLQHVNETLSRGYTTNNSGMGLRNWVYDQAKGADGDEQILDFLALTLKDGTTDLLSHTLRMNQNLSGGYKDYLLLVLSQHRITSTWAQRLLGIGADPNATFYQGLRSKLKISPWIQYLTRTRSQVMVVATRAPDVEIVNTFLNGGANPDDRTILFIGLNQSLQHESPLRFPVILQGQIQDMFRSSVSLYECPGPMLIIEVNAKYILEELYRSGLVEESAWRAEVLSRPDVQQSRTHRKVLLCHPGGKDGYHVGHNSEDLSKGPCSLDPDDKDHRLSSSDTFRIPCFGEVGFEDSERILDGFELLQNLPTSPRVRIQVRKLKEVPDLWRKLPKVDIKLYLKERGYYKEAGDPAVMRGPPPMFEDCK